MDHAGSLLARPHTQLDSARRHGQRRRQGPASAGLDPALAAVLVPLLLGPACRPSPSLESGASYASESSPVPAAAASPSSGAGERRTAAAELAGMADTPPPLLADVAPVSALAFDGRFLWVGSTRGLRRVWVGARAADWLEADAGPGARDVTALAIDGARTVWVGSASEVGVLASNLGRGRGALSPSPAPSPASSAAPPRAAPPAAGAGVAAPAAPPYYRRLAAVPGVTRILPISSTADRHDAWVGTETGLVVLADGATTPIQATTGDVVTCLAAAVDGRSLWVGLRRRGLVRLDLATFSSGLPSPTVLARLPVTEIIGPEPPGGLDFVNPVGITWLPNGTSIAVGRARAGGTRLVLLAASGAVLMAPQAGDLPVQAVGAGCRVAAGGGRLGVLAASAPGVAEPACEGALGNLVGGPDLAPMLYRLEVVPRGESIAPGSVRFAPTHRALESPRIIARPVAKVGLQSVTVVAEGSASASAEAEATPALFVGTRTAGAARITARGVTTILPSGELGHHAAHLSLACTTAERCLIATGTPHGWELTEPDQRLESLPVTTLGGHLMALAPAPDGSTFSVAGDPGRILRIGHLSADGARFEPVGQVQIPIAGAAIATSAAVSPRGDLWVAIRERRPRRPPHLPSTPGAAPAKPGAASASADVDADASANADADASNAEAEAQADVPRGVVEIQLPSLRVVHHRAYTAGEKVPPEVIPIDADVRALGFEVHTADTPQSMWFCTAHGIFRFREGTLDRWGENNGLASEQCHDLLVPQGGARPASVWAATAGGPSRFDGKDWHALARWPTDADGDGLAARGLTELRGRLWIGTPRGLWSAAASPPSDPRTTVWERDARLTDTDLAGVTSDRFGRLWALGRSGVTRLAP